MNFNHLPSIITSTVMGNAYTYLFSVYVLVQFRSVFTRQLRMIQMPFFDMILVNKINKFKYKDLVFMILEFISDPAQSHHSKAHGNCCNKQTTTTHKDAKETKTKKPNWSIKFNCTKLKGKHIFFHY